MTKTQTTDTATCQLCERTCKLVRGMISLHGYNRPGDGFITGKCPGSRNVSWAVGHNVVDQYIADLGGRLAYVRELLVVALDTQANADETTEYPHGQAPRTWKRGERFEQNFMSLDMFAIVCGNRVSKFESEITRLEREIARQTKRVAGWVAA